MQTRGPTLYMNSRHTFWSSAAMFLTQRKVIWSPEVRTVICVEQVVIWLDKGVTGNETMAVPPEPLWSHYVLMSGHRNPSHHHAHTLKWKQHCLCSFWISAHQWLEFTDLFSKTQFVAILFLFWLNLTLIKRDLDATLELPAGHATVWTLRIPKQEFRDPHRMF